MVGQYWLCYVDDTFTAVHKDAIDDFHEHLNKQNADIQITKEIEENGKIPILDCLVSRQQQTTNDYLQKTDTYRPITGPVFVQPDLSQGLLLSGLWLVCHSPDSLQDETDYLNVFSKNNYNKDFVRRNTHSNTDSNTQTNVNSGPVTTVTLPYIRGTSETIV